MAKIDFNMEKLKSQIAATGSYQAVHTWYSALNERDRLVVKGLSVLFAIALFISWIWQPMIKANQSAESKLASELKFHSFMKENAHKIRKGAAPSSAGGSILGTVNQLAKTKGIALKRFEPEGSNGLRVWLDKVEFNKAIDWLELLEAEKGIEVEQISIDKVNPGIVNIRVVLKS
jgi:general secretion pathway protein M